MVEIQKPSLSEFEDCLEEGVLLFLNDGTPRNVAKYNKFKHQITFDDGETVDLYIYYDLIQFALFLHDSKGNPTKLTKLNDIITAVSSITNSCKYHIYANVIKAYLEGDRHHYIYKWCKDCPCFGEYSYIDEDTIKELINKLVEARYLKVKISKRGVPYYLKRKDGKFWPKARKNK